MRKVLMLAHNVPGLQKAFEENEYIVYQDSSNITKSDKNIVAGNNDKQTGNTNFAVVSESFAHPSCRPFPLQDGKQNIMAEFNISYSVTCICTQNTQINKFIYFFHTYSEHNKVIHCFEQAES